MHLGLAAILNLLIIFKNSETKNMALGKRSRFCDTRVLSDKLTDGNINSSEEITLKCGRKAFLDIDLGSNYYILYVLIYDGSGSKGQLDYFVVRLFVSGAAVLCFQYPDPSPGPGIAMRVNCEHQGPTSKVRIESHKDEGFVISEVEIYILAIHILTTTKMPIAKRRWKSKQIKRKVRDIIITSEITTSTTPSTTVTTTLTVESTTTSVTEFTRTTDFPDEMPCRMMDGYGVCQCYPGYTNVDNTTCKWFPKFRDQKDYQSINFFAYSTLGLIAFLVAGQILWSCLSYEESSITSSLET